jgi:hypothetical protein
LFTGEAHRKPPIGIVKDWTSESLLPVRQAYQDPATGLRITRGAKSGDDRWARSPAVANRRLYQAGARLAPAGLAGALDRVRVVDAFASLADPARGVS